MLSHAGVVGSIPGADKVFSEDPPNHAQWYVHGTYGIYNACNAGSVIGTSSGLAFTRK